MKKANLVVTVLPATWPVSEWTEKAPDAYPGNTARGRRFVIEHEEELIACGALTRIGRQKIIIGAGYAVFIMKGMAGVKNFQITPNDPERLKERQARRIEKQRRGSESVAA